MMLFFWLTLVCCTDLSSICYLQLILLFYTKIKFKFLLIQVKSVDSCFINDYDAVVIPSYNLCLMPLFLSTFYLIPSSIKLQSQDRYIPKWQFNDEDCSIDEGIIIRITLSLLLMIVSYFTSTHTYFSLYYTMYISSFYTLIHRNSVANSREGVVQGIPYEHTFHAYITYIALNSLIGRPRSLVREIYRSPHISYQSYYYICLSFPRGLAYQSTPWKTYSEIFFGLR